jgi:uncharacterized protein DUF6134
VCHARTPVRDFRWLLFLVALLGFAAPCRAQEAETRRFVVLIDGKQAGSYVMKYRAEQGGLCTVSHQAKVRFTSYLVYTYTYSFTGSETWRDRDLVRWSGTANDDGKRFQISAQRGANDFRITVNSAPRSVRPGFLLTTYCFRPAGQPHGQKQTLVDADTGKEMQAIIDYVGAEGRILPGQRETCAHYRIRGDVQVDLWFDSQGRLAYQESLEDGHRSVLRLVQKGRAAD